jgi:hypothetical protein
MNKQGWKRQLAAGRQFGRGLAVVLAGIVLVSAMAGCSTTGGLTGSPTPEALAARAQERAAARWQAVIDGDLARSYSFFSPASKETVSLDQYKAKVLTTIKYRKIEPPTATCDKESCEVRLFAWYDHRLMAGIRTPVDEIWALDKGELWYVWRQ